MYYVHMRILIFTLLAAATAMSVCAQAKPTTASEYDAIDSYAVRATNAAFPFVFKVVTENFERGKLVSTETEINERQAQGVERETKTLEEGGKTLHSYSIMVGFGNNTYCSTDGVIWKGPQQYVCPAPGGSGLLRLSRPRTPETAEYTVTESTVAGKPVKIYRKYAVYSASAPDKKQTFEEKIATIDSRGFFISVTNAEGSINPKTVSLTRTQTWDFSTKLKPIVAPK
jgi:hypothetical protein